MQKDGTLKLWWAPFLETKKFVRHSLRVIVSFKRDLLVYPSLRAAKFTIIHPVGAEVRVFSPRRAPLLSCGISSDQNLQCVAVTDCIEDLGVQCLSQALVEQITADSEQR